MNIYEKLLSVQTELKAPKGQFNSFGKYKYRSCEDILEAVKPVLVKNKATIFLTDDVRLIGERYYIEATAHFIDCEDGKEITAKAFAREDESKKGMDGSQVTGASSSYARKYALNGLLDIDDTKDADSEQPEQPEQPKQPKQPEQKTPRELLIEKLQEQGINATAYATEKKLNKATTNERYEELLKELDN